MTIGLYMTRPSSTLFYSTASSDTTVEEKSKVHGSYHWDYERALSVVSLPLILSAMVVGPQPAIDLALGIVIPAHCHLGFDAVITDYLPKRRVGALHSVATWALRITTLLTLYGCYSFNTNDIGITEFVKRVWTGKKDV